MTKKIKLLLVDDHKMIRDGIKALIGFNESITSLKEASNGLDAIKLVKKKKVDIILMDINMPGMSGIETTIQLLKLNPKLKIIALTMHNEDAYIIDMIKVGAVGYVLKESGRDELMRAIQFVNRGEKYIDHQVSVELIDELKNENSKIFKSHSHTASRGHGLTKREIQVIQLMVKGESNQTIAESLSISKRTVEVHRRNAFRKTEVKNSVALLKFAFENNII